MTVFDLFLAHRDSSYETVWSIYQNDKDDISFRGRMYNCPDTIRKLIVDEFWFENNIMYVICNQMVVRYE